MGCMPRASHRACVLSLGTKAGSGDRMAKKEKSRILGSSGVLGASGRGSCLALFTLGVAGVVMTCSAGVDFGGIFALRAHCTLLLDYVPPEEPPSTPLGKALRIR